MRDNWLRVQVCSLPWTPIPASFQLFFPLSNENPFKRSESDQIVRNGIDFVRGGTKNFLEGPATNDRRLYPRPFDVFAYTKIHRKRPQQTEECAQTFGSAFR